MNASTIISDDMTLDEKLAAIDRAIAASKEQSEQRNESTGRTDAPSDPQDLLMCEGCQ